MKKIINLCIIGFISLFVLTGCSNKNIEGSLEDLMTKVYENIPDDEKPMMLSNIEVNEENVEYYLGVKDIKIKEALASESMTGSIAHSIVLLRVANTKDIEDIKVNIKENINPRKWICVEAENVIVKNKGDLIILIMTSNALSEKIENNFDNL
ncbi:MAG: hypothetical protein IJD92_01410 [Bacilli bacterium]|nr:hypothetical protein [Bacilli bacterium]